MCLTEQLANVHAIVSECSHFPWMVFGEMDILGPTFRKPIRVLAWLWGQEGAPGLVGHSCCDSDWHQLMS